MRHADFAGLVGAAVTEADWDDEATRADLLAPPVEAADAPITTPPTKAAMPDAATTRAPLRWGMPTHERRLNIERIESGEQGHQSENQKDKTEADRCEDNDEQQHDCCNDPE